MVIKDFALNEWTVPYVRGKPTASGIPYKIVGGVNFYARREVKICSVICLGRRHDDPWHVPSLMFQSEA